MPNGCPSGETLSAFARGHVSEDVGEAISQHIDECKECQSTASKSAANDDPFLHSLRASSTSTDFSSEPELWREIERIKAEPPWSDGNENTITPPPVRRIRDYELLGRLGQGSMGTVYRARHTKLDRLVAIKTLAHRWTTTREASARFARELRAIGALDHVNVVRAFDGGEENGQLFLVTELLDGSNAESLVRHVGPLESADACEIVRQGALGLDYAFRQGVFHRDVKPSNLMVTRKGTVKLLDLGLAKLLEPSSSDPGLTEDGQIVGTVNFMAPERYRGQNGDLDVRSDIFSLGCSLYFLLSGKSPFVSPTPKKPAQWDSRGRRLVSLSSLRDDVPGSLLRVLARLMAEDAADRYAEPRDVATALEAFSTASDLRSLTKRAIAREARVEVEEHTAEVTLNRPSTLGPERQDQSRKRAVLEPLRGRGSVQNEFFKITLGGVVGITLAVVILWFTAGLDPLGVFKGASGKQLANKGDRADSMSTVGTPREDDSGRGGQRAPPGPPVEVHTIGDVDPGDPESTATAQSDVDTSPTNQGEDESPQTAFESDSDETAAEQLLPEATENESERSPKPGLREDDKMRMIFALTAMGATIPAVFGVENDEGFSSQEAKDAKLQYESALADLEVAYGNAVQRHRNEYVVNLREAGKASLDREDDTEAQRILAETKRIKEAALPGTKQFRQEVARLRAKVSELERQLDDKALPARIPRHASTFKGHSYLVLPEKMPKRLAIEACKDLGGELVKIESRQENHFVWRLISRHGITHAYIQGGDDHAEGKWLFSDGTRIKYFNWMQHQPSNVGWDINGAENAIGMREDNGGWFDISSDARMGVVVEWNR